MIVAPSPGSPEWVGDIADGWRRLGISAQSLWIGYFGLGGNGSLADVNGWLARTVELPALDHDLLAQALNDAFSDQGMGRPLGYR